MAALAGYLSGTQQGDLCEVSVTPSSAADTYLAGLANAAGTSAGGTEWARSLGSGFYVCGLRALDKCAGTYTTPPAAGAGDRLAGGGLIGR